MTKLSSTSYGRPYHSFAGSDIVCTFAGKHIAALQGLSWNIQREKTPLFTCGSANPRSFSRGKRGIGGSMVFQFFDREALLDALRGDQLYLANRYEIQESLAYTRVYDLAAANGLLAMSSFVDTGIATADGNFGPIAVTIDKVLASPRYVDEIPPFDIVITMANEYGHIAQKSIIGVEILNVGSGFSVDSMSIDEAMTYVAREITPTRNQHTVDQSTGNVTNVSSGRDPSIT